MNSPSSSSGSGSKYSRFKPKSQSSPLRWITLLVFLFAFIWFLAVVKVFLLEKSKVYSTEAANFAVSGADDDDSMSEMLLKPMEKTGNDIGGNSFLTFQSHREKKGAQELGRTIRGEPLPRIGDWTMIRAPVGDSKSPGERKPRPAFHQRPAPVLPAAPRDAELKVPKVIETPSQLPARPREEMKAAVVPTNVDENGKVPAHKLPWPPVQPDGTILAEEGFDTMAMTGLKVPRFWAPPPGVDPNDLDDRVNGEPTIFLMIASYRDFQCRETIAIAFERADHPERLFVGAVDQVVDGDTGCLDLAVPCSQNPKQKICIYMNQISIFKMDATLATGPVTARHIGDRMYRGQQFFMQMDAHCQFVNHWDSGIIGQWKSTKNEMAVLSSYLTDVQGSITPAGESTRNTRPIMCNSDFEGLMPAKYIRHNSQPEEVPSIKDMPQMQPYWAAGFSFSKGHFIVRVPYDAYQSMVFQGEEISIGVRGFTYGYDFYAPRTSVVFHEYAERSSRRKKIPMFWENSAAHRGAGVKALKRSMSIIGMAPDVPPEEWDHSEIDKYGIGNVRSVDLFYKLFLIDVQARKATQLCPFVKSGKMHNNFQRYLRPDGRGIDYSNLENFDTRAVIENHLAAQRPFGEDMIRNALKNKNMQGMQEAINNAVRIGIDRTNPALFKQGKNFLDGV